jgi:hypothetical protein
VATSEWAHGFCASWVGPVKTTPRDVLGEQTGMEG